MSAPGCHWSTHNAMIELFHHYECKSYRVALLSKSTCFYFFTAAILYTVPLVPAFFGFTLRPLQLNRWVEFSNCDVPAEGSFAVFGTRNKVTNHDSMLTWFGKRPNGEGFFDSVALDVDSQVSGTLETTRNEIIRVSPLLRAGQKKLQAIFVLLRVNIENKYEILSHQWFLPMRCSLEVDGHDQMEVTGIMPQKYSTGKGQMHLDVYGRAKIIQKEPITFQYTRHFAYMNSETLLSRGQESPPVYALMENIVQSATKRNFTLKLEGVKTAASFGNRQGIYYIQVRIDTPKQQLIFEAPLVYRLKWNFISYMSLWIIIAWPIRRIRQYVFQNNLLNDCTITFPHPPQ